MRIIIEPFDGIRDLREGMLKILDAVDRLGYERGLREGQSRLEVLSAFVPESVTKHWLIAEAKRHAEILGTMREIKTGTGEG